MLVAIARHLDGTLLFSSQPEVLLRFAAKPGLSVQQQNGTDWDVFTVIQRDRVVQVAQPVKVRREAAAESASQLLMPLTLLVLLIGGLLVAALRRGLRPLGLVNSALRQRNASSLEPLNPHGVPREVLPLVLTLNELFQRLAAAFEAQRSFVANAAHELRSPVTALQLQVQVLERSVNPAEKIEAMAELSAGSARMRRLIEQLLRLSSSSPDTATGLIAVAERVSLAEVVREVVVRQSVEAERRCIDLGAQVGSELTVSGNAAQLEILLNNLVENALRYAGGGGVVDVMADRFEGSPSLRVVDDGPGVSLADRPRVFERFYRSREAVASAESGSGLGLAIVKAIADRHGAVVSLHTGRDEKGLEVRVVFPLA
jgi:signal transduction histidine kinase